MTGSGGASIGGRWPARDPYEGLHRAYEAVINIRRGRDAAGAAQGGVEQW